MEGNILYSYHATLGYACPPKYTINAHDQSEDTTGRKATLNVNNEVRLYFFYYLYQFSICGIP